MMGESSDTIDEKSKRTWSGDFLLGLNFGRLVGMVADISLAALQYKHRNS